MRTLCAISDEEAKALDDFKKRHEKCDEYVTGITKATGDCFTYTYIPTSLSGLVTVECACGAKWSSSDFGITETEACSAKDIDFDDLDIKAIKHLVSAAKRPSMHFGRGCNEPIRNIEALNQGISVILHEVRPDGAYLALADRLRIRIAWQAGPDPQNLSDDNGRLIRKAGDGWKAFEIWRDELIACLREEFPTVAEECGLLANE